MNQEPNFFANNDENVNTMTTPNQVLIEELLQTIESLNSTMIGMREEIAFLRQQLAKMDASLEDKELEQKRLLALIEAKDQDNRQMGKQIADLLVKVATLTKELENTSL